MLENDLEIGKAIAIYDNIKSEGFQDAELDRHLKELQKLWKTANAEHQDARNFIYRVWPTLDTARMKDNLPKAQKAFQTCEAAGDVLSIRKLLKGIEIHADRLTQELSELHPETNPDEEKPARLIKEVSTDLVNLGKEIQEYLLKTQSPDK